MRTIVTVVQMLVRILFLVLIVFGIAFWTGHAMNLIPLHMMLGVAFVVCLWITSIAAALARVSPALVAAGILWGIVVAAFGMTQTQLLAGPSHWIVQAAHLIFGMAAIALNERLSRLVLATA